MIELLFFILLIPITLMFLAQVLPMIFAVRVQGKYSSEIDQFIRQHDQAEHRVLLYFWSTSCGQCRPMTPVVAELIADGEPLLEIDISDKPELARAAGILATPGFSLVKDGVVIRNMLGQKTRKEILEILHDD